MREWFSIQAARIILFPFSIADRVLTKMFGERGLVFCLYCGEVTIEKTKCIWCGIRPETVDRNYHRH